MMEALRSEQALSDAMNEGGASFMRSLPKTSLPQRRKTHIFEGLDTDFIARDILKIPTCQSSLSASIQPSPTVLENSPVSQLQDRKSEASPVFRLSSKYKNFVREETARKEETFRDLPVLQHRSREIPLNYNTFISTKVEGSRKCRAAEDRQAQVLRCSEELIQMQRVKQEERSYPSFEKLRLHVEDVKRLMGRENSGKMATTCATKSTRSTSSRAPTEHSGPRGHTSTSSFSPIQPVKFSRYSQRNVGSELRSSLSTRGKQSIRSAFSSSTAAPSVRFSFTAPLSFNGQKSPRVPAIQVQGPR